MVPVAFVTTFPAGDEQLYCSFVDKENAVPAEVHATVGTTKVVEEPEANVTGVILYNLPVEAVVPVVEEK